ncbi:hypothetical protein ACN47A_08815 [Myxococcus fulvus]|uniref:hypothetical protein n=1 Tax=Myxococcus fulvus TaxID=33 RepID=UPI003B9CA073
MRRPGEMTRRTNRVRSWGLAVPLAAMVLGGLGCAGKQARPDPLRLLCEPGSAPQPGMVTVKVDADFPFPLESCIDPGGTIVFTSARCGTTIVLFGHDSLFEESQSSCLHRARDCSRAPGFYGSIDFQDTKSCEVTLARDARPGSITYVVNTGLCPSDPSGTEAGLRPPPLEVIVGKLDVATSTQGGEDDRATPR